MDSRSDPGLAQPGPSEEFDIRYSCTKKGEFRAKFGFSTLPMDAYRLNADSNTTHITAGPSDMDSVGTLSGTALPTDAEVSDSDDSERDLETDSSQGCLHSPTSQALDWPGLDPPNSKLELSRSATEPLSPATEPLSPATEPLSPATEPLSPATDPPGSTMDSARLETDLTRSDMAVSTASVVDSVCDGDVVVEGEFQGSYDDDDDDDERRNEMRIVHSSKSQPLKSWIKSKYERFCSVMVNKVERFDEQYGIAPETVPDLHCQYDFRRWTAKSKATFRSSSPIVLLGRFYDHKDHSVSDDSSTSPNTSFRMRPLTGHEVTVGNYEEFKRSFDSFFWFTYRREFTKMEGSSYTSDCGWGCMLRSGQMLLAEGLRKHFLGKDWSYHRRQKSGEELFHRQIITWCSDKLDVHCPFSVHQLVNAGNKVGKKAGDWYGPASVAHILKAAMEEGSKMNPLLAQLKVYVAQDCTIYKGDVKELCKETRRRTSGPKFEESSEHSSVEEPLIWRPVIVLVPVRLGGESLNHIYTSGVQYFLQLNRCIGVIGGRPKHSLYFTGYQDEHLIYLDPHYCQQCVDTDKKDFDLSSFHCRTPQKMNIKNMDPSCTIGFYFRTEAQFDEFCTLFNDEMAPNRNTPIFVIQEGKLEYEGSSDDDRVQVDCVLRIPHYDEDGNVLNHSNDDFVML